MSSPDIFTPLQTLSGTTEEKFTKIYRYLFQLADQLNRAAVAADETVVAASIAAAKSSAQASAKDLSEKAASLKDLILANADLVTVEIDEIGETLTKLETASSEYGEWQSVAENRITANADGITQIFTGMESIEGAANEALSYTSLLSGYIRAGVVEYQGVIPVLGIMISQNFEETGTEEIGGETYTKLESASFHSVFTSNALKFYNGDLLVAYMSNDRLYITDAVFVGRTQYGPEGSPQWEINYDNGFTIKYVGG